MSDTLIVFCLLVVALLVVVGSYANRWERARRLPRGRDAAAAELDPQNVRVVRDRLDAFERDSLAYEIFLAGNRLNLSAEHRTRLEERYGRVVQEPVLMLSDLGEQGLDFGAVRGCVAAILREKGLALNESQTIGRMASDALRERARAKVSVILRS